jgi:hypothetical protein
MGMVSTSVTSVLTHHTSSIRVKGASDLGADIASPSSPGREQAWRIGHNLGNIRLRRSDQGEF